MKTAKPGETIDNTELPSEAFDRQEVIVLMGESVTEGRKQQMLPIIRSDNHMFFGFGDSAFEKLDKMEGRFSQLLPTKKPDEKMRALALAMLKVKGMQQAKGGVELILYCIQYNINYPIEASEGLDEGWGGFELAQAVGQGVFDGVHRVIIVIAKRLPAHLPPDQFLGVALRAVSGQPIQGQVVRHYQRLGPMPACPIQKHQNVLVGMPLGDFGQIQRHGGGVGVGQDQADEFPVMRTNTAKDMGVLTHPTGGHLRTNAQRCPASDRVAHPAKPGFILKHQPQRLVWVPNRHRVHFGLKFF